MRPYLTAPMIVDFNITKRCNLKCKYCYANADNYNTESELSLDEIKNILGELAQLNVQTIRLSGGEPLIRKDYCEIVNYCNELGLFVCTNTNGTLITEEIIKCFKKECVKNIGISLDSYIPSVHNKLRGEVFAFEKTLDGIHKMIDAGLVDKFAVVITLSNENIEIKNVEKLLDFLSNIGVKYVSFQYSVSVGRGEQFDNCMPDYNKWKNIVVWLYSNREVYASKHDIEYTINLTNESDCKFELFFPFAELGRVDLLKTVEGAESSNESEYISCQAGNTTIAITAEGKVYPCELMMCYKELEAGDLRKTTFFDIWNNSDVLNEIRNIKIDELNGICSSCSMKNVCGGGCRAVSFALTHNIKDCDYRCPRVYESINRFTEKVKVLGVDVIIRKEYDGYYFTHPYTLKMYKINKTGFIILKKMLLNMNKDEIVNQLLLDCNLNKKSAEQAYYNFSDYLYKEKIITKGV